jgi:hypothetical protein
MDYPVLSGAMGESGGTSSLLDVNVNVNAAAPRDPTLSQ